jgi:precorrin-8X/cobalt-precorrin-8 methylmutase
MAELAYLRDGAAIYERSFAIIRAEADLARFSPDEADVAVRMIHACGLVEAARQIEFGPGLVAATRAALAQGAPILCDAEMVAHGITRARLAAGNSVVCTLRDPRVPALAERLGTTRSAAALDLWGERLAILGIPVGFVGAAESKDALAAGRHGVPYLIVRGRMGGSAMTAAAVNALARAGS